MKTDYHVFQHFPSEAMEAFARLGIDAKKLEQEGLLSIWDSFTQTVKYEDEKKEKPSSELNMWLSTHDKPLDIVKRAARWAERAKESYSGNDKRVPSH
jgi:hypothetical protein